MNHPEETLIACLQPLESLLRQGFGAQGSDLAALVADTAGDLPHDLAEELQTAAGKAALLKASAPSAGLLIDFAFHCGCLHERLDALRQGRAIERLGFVPANALPPEDLGKADLDALARFAAARDRFLKTVADFTLKFLVVATLLLVLGLALGLV